MGISTQLLPLKIFKMMISMLVLLIRSLINYTEKLNIAMTMNRKYMNLSPKMRMHK